MDRTEILERLDRLDIEYEIAEHEAARTIEEIDGFDLPNSGYIAKNLFLRDDKKRDYCLPVVPKDKVVDLKELRTALGTRPLSFASEDDLLRLLGLHKGAVTPFGVMNDESRSVQVVIGGDVRSYPSVGVHPNENTATVWLSPDDLMRAIGEHGNPVRIADVPGRRSSASSQ